MPHPIFERHNGAPEDVSDEQRAALKPDLVLAYHFIWERTCLFNFWVRLTHAPPIRPTDGSHFYLWELSITPDKLLQTKDILERMAQVTSFFASKKLEHRVASGNLGEAHMPGSPTHQGKLCDF